MGDLELDVWVLIPTAQRDHVSKNLAKWREQGYKVGLFIDPGPIKVPVEDHDLVVRAPYPGIWKAWNLLAHAALRLGVDVCVLAGDDMTPDPTLRAEEIAKQYLEKFPDGFGVMQPCGDMQGDKIDGVPNSGRICGSPWIGRAWIRMAYGGSGPTCDIYDSFYADEDCKNYAEKMGKLWMRPDLTQFHAHWAWGHTPKRDYHDRNQKHWEADKEIFERRKASGFA